MVKVAFFSTLDYERTLFTKLNQFSSVNIHFFDSGLYDHIGLLKGYEVICTDYKEELNSTILEELYQRGVELIALRHRSLHAIDLKAAYQKVRIIRPAPYPIEPAAEQALSLLLNLAQSIDYYDAQSKYSIANIKQVLKGRTAGVIGVGRLGKQIASLARGMQMPVLLYDHQHDKPFAKQTGCNYVDLGLLYAKADIIFLAAPLTKETFHMLNAKTIKQLRPRTIVIALSSEMLIDIKAAYQAIDSGHLRGLGIDLLHEDEIGGLKQTIYKPISSWWIEKLIKHDRVAITQRASLGYISVQRQLAENLLDDINSFALHTSLKREVKFKK